MDTIGQKIIFAKEAFVMRVATLTKPNFPLVSHKDPFRDLYYFYLYKFINTMPQIFQFSPMQILTANVGMPVHVKWFRLDKISLYYEKKISNFIIYSCKTNILCGFV